MRNINTNKFNLTKDIRDKLFRLFGHPAMGYYYTIIEILIAEPSHLWECGKVNKLSRIAKINKNILEKFIDFCTKTQDTNGLFMLSKNKNHIWSDAVLLKYHRTNKQKTKNGGRRKIPLSESTRLKNAELVHLTQKQHEKLIQKYGYIFTQKAIEILNNWLKENTTQSAPYQNRNNYGHFRSDSWVITETKNYFQT